MKQLFITLSLLMSVAAFASSPDIAGSVSDKPTEIKVKNSAGEIIEYSLKYLNSGKYYGSDFHLNNNDYNSGIFMTDGGPIPACALPYLGELQEQASITIQSPDGNSRQIEIAPSSEIQKTYVWGQCGQNSTDLSELAIGTKALNP